MSENWFQSHTEFFVPVMYMAHKLCWPYRNELNPKLSNFWYVYSIAADLYKAMRTECLKILSQSHSEFVPVKYMTHKLCRHFHSELNPKLTNFWYQMNVHILTICIILKKTVHVSSTFSQ